MYLARTGGRWSPRGSSSVGDKSLSPDKLVNQSKLEI